MLFSLTSTLLTQELRHCPTHPPSCAQVENVVHVVPDLGLTKNWRKCAIMKKREKVKRWKRSDTCSTLCLTKYFCRVKAIVIAQKRVTTAEREASALSRFVPIWTAVLGQANRSRHVCFLHMFISKWSS